MNRRHSARLIGAMLLMVLSAVGCKKAGPATATLSGTMTVDGQKVPHGSVTFSPAGHGPVTGALVRDGEFRCERVPLGKHHVTFQAQAAEMRPIMDISTRTFRQVPHDILPAYFRNGLRAEIEAEQMHIDFDLRSVDAAAGDSG